MKPYTIIEGKENKVPIIISIPHCGTNFPDEIKNKFIPEQISSLDDTDWYLQDLYNFAPDMGITIIHANYSRWLIDLNRNPQSTPLYNDGRVITGLVTETDFLGNPIYKPGMQPTQDDINSRIEHYYKPYYQKIQELLTERKNQFGKVLLWDAHSIRRSVLTIRKDPFPEMILGDNDCTSAHEKLIAITLKALSKHYQVNHNDPFKGGHITRSFGNPSNGIHALQLERNKNLYMDEAERNFDENKANKMRDVLKANFELLIEELLR